MTHMQWLHGHGGRASTGYTQSVVQSVCGCEHSPLTCAQTRTRANVKARPRPLLRMWTGAKTKLDQTTLHSGSSRVLTKVHSGRYMVTRSCNTPQHQTTLKRQHEPNKQNTCARQQNMLPSSSQHLCLLSYCRVLLVVMRQ